MSFRLTSDVVLALRSREEHVPSHPLNVSSGSVVTCAGRPTMPSPLVQRVIVKEAVRALLMFLSASVSVAVSR